MNLSCNMLDFHKSGSCMVACLTTWKESKLNFELLYFHTGSFICLASWGSRQGGRGALHGLPRIPGWSGKLDSPVLIFLYLCFQPLFYDLGAEISVGSMLDQVLVEGSCWINKNRYHQGKATSALPKCCVSVFTLFFLLNSPEGGGWVSWRVPTFPTWIESSKLSCKEIPPSLQKWSISPITKEYSGILFLKQKKVERKKISLILSLFQL